MRNFITMTKQKKCMCMFIKKTYLFVCEKLTLKRTLKTNHFFRIYQVIDLVV